MLNGALGEQHLSLSLVTGQTSLERRADDVIEHKSSIDKKREADNLEPFEALPAESKRNKPDEESAAGIDCATGSSRDSTGDRQAEEVEATRTNVRGEDGKMDLRSKINTYPILIMMNTLDTATARLPKTSCNPCLISK